MGYSMNRLEVMSTANSSTDSIEDEQPIKAVIFDYGEVMWLQSRNVHVYRNIERDNGLLPNTLLPTLVSEELSNILPKQFHNDLLKGKYTAKDFDKFFSKAYNHKYNKKYKLIRFFSAVEYDKDAVYEEAVLIGCKKIRAKGIKTILLLDTYHVDEKKNGRRIPNMDKYFDIIIESCIEGVKKPDPQFLKIPLQRANIEPDEAIYIDDSKANCMSASLLGMKYIQVFNTMDMLEDLQEMIGFDLE